MIRQPARNLSPLLRDIASKMSRTSSHHHKSPNRQAPITPRKRKPLCARQLQPIEIGPRNLLGTLILEHVKCRTPSIPKRTHAVRGADQPALLWLHQFNLATESQLNQKLLIARKPALSASEEDWSKSWSKLEPKIGFMIFYSD